MIIEMAPPVSAVASPAFTATRPPVDTLPLPTTILMLPPVPNVAEPVRNVIIPLDPPVTVLPDENEREPLTPFEPELAVRMLKVPLDFARPYPVMIEIAPPVEDPVASPALTATRPPVELFPLPTTILMLPPAPEVAAPVRKVIMPLLPFDVVPEVKDNEPLTPLAPALAVRTLNTPLDVARP